jgi:hypothetical protein
MNHGQSGVGVHALALSATAAHAVMRAKHRENTCDRRAVGWVGPERADAGRVPVHNRIGQRRFGVWDVRVQYADGASESQIFVPQIVECSCHGQRCLTRQCVLCMVLQELDLSMDNVIVVDNLPVVPPEKVEKLAGLHFSETRVSVCARTAGHCQSVSQNQRGAGSVEGSRAIAGASRIPMKTTTRYAFFPMSG